MNADLNLKRIVDKAKKISAKLVVHLPFIFILVVLLSYLFVVWKISSLATVEPTTEQESAALAQSDIPKVNKKAVAQIESLEKNNTEVHSLFEQARNNPFDE